MCVCVCVIAGHDYLNYFTAFGFSLIGLLFQRLLQVSPGSFQGTFASVRLFTGQMPRQQCQSIEGTEYGCRRCFVLY